jgi:hypothetical protein
MMIGSTIVSGAGTVHSNFRGPTRPHSTGGSRILGTKIQIKSRFEADPLADYFCWLVKYRSMLILSDNTSMLQLI